MIKGRGSSGNKTGRYEECERVALDDGWYRDLDSSPSTSVQVDFSKTAIVRNKSPDLPFDQSINMYRGCEHGCIYCYARPTHCYLGYSAGLDFETKLLYKPEVVQKVEEEITRPSYTCQPIALGTNTDPYQPIERTYELTRQLLNLFLRYRHPVTIVTKSYSIVRDIEVLAELAKLNLVHVGISVTTLSNQLSRTMEPRASAPGRRLKAIDRLSAANIPVTIMFSPVILGLNDHELESVLQEGRNNGAKMATWILLRLPLEVRDLFYNWLEQNYPLKASKVRNMVRQSRDGRDNNSEFYQRFRGSGVMTELFQNRFKSATNRLGLDGELPPLDVTLFRKSEQYSLF